MRSFRNSGRAICYESESRSLVIPSLREVCKQECPIADNPGNNAVVKQENLRTYINLSSSSDKLEHEHALACWSF